jgi:hypothetical protein
MIYDLTPPLSTITCQFIFQVGSYLLFAELASPREGWYIYITAEY